MCFRPSAAAMEMGPVQCHNCGKSVNPVMGNLPDKCPYCSAPIEDKPAEIPAPAAPVSPTAPATPAAPQPPVAQ